ncbi:MAG: DUF998 domain-containing protein [Promethearchaeota archaeon]|nr:MAG: DUF998 domain-containing protein [Candidatus Lokiarchaeota archaeon]
MKIKLKYKLEALFGLFSTMIFSIMLILALLFSPNYSFFENYISDLAYFSGKLFFAIGFSIFGVFLVPFFITLERELVYINENIRRLATTIAILTCTCFALGSIIPEESYLEIFNIFHSLIAGFAFFFSGVYILLFSYLMYRSYEIEEYSGPKFQLFLVSFGFITAIGEFVLIFIFVPILEWIVVISMVVWIIITNIHLLIHKFIRFPLAELKRLKHSESIEIFKAIQKKIDELNINDKILSDAIDNNLFLLKKRNDENRS